MGRTKKKPKKPVPTRSVQYDGETYVLPIIAPGRKNNALERRKIAHFVGLVYTDPKYNFSDCAKLAGVSDRVLNNWANTYSEISDIFKEAQTARADNQKFDLRERALGLTEKLLSGGYTRKVKATAREKHGGNWTDVAQTEREIFIRPTTKLIETVLYNTAPDLFKRNPDDLPPDGDGDGIPPIEWVD